MGLLYRLTLRPNVCACRLWIQWFSDRCNYFQMVGHYRTDIISGVDDQRSNSVKIEDPKNGNTFKVN